MSVQEESSSEYLWLTNILGTGGFQYPFIHHGGTEKIVEFPRDLCGEWGFQERLTPYRRFAGDSRKHAHST